VSIYNKDVAQAALPHYEVGDELGAGGSGVVFDGRHRLVGRRVAIKVLTGAGSRELLLREARILAELDHHPHVVRIHEYHDSPVQLLVMEHLSGGTLKDRMSAGRLDPAVVCAVGIAVAEALTFAHAAGVLHRDIKPANILFGSDGTPKVADFGVAKSHAGVGDRNSGLVGTLGYMAPEQFFGGEIGPQTDVYALGVVLYQLLAGHLPFSTRRSDGEVRPWGEIWRMQVATAPPAPQAPDALVRVVMKAIQPQPSDRHATARKLALELARAGAKLSEPSEPGWLDTTGIRLLVDAEVRAAAQPSSGDSFDPADEPTARPSSVTDTNRASHTALAKDAVTVIRIDQPRWRQWRPAAAIAGALALVLVAATLFTVRPWESDPNPPASGAPTSAAGDSGVARNSATDRGVSATTVKVGIITGATSPYGQSFASSGYGAHAYFQALNASGGVHGRQVQVFLCDDKSSATGNNACVRKLIDEDGIFALAGVTVFTYAGAGYVNSHGIPDVGGQPIDNAYDTYPHLYSIYGSIYPRDGSKPGFNGKLVAGTEAFRYFKTKLAARTAAVVYFNIAASERYAAHLKESLVAEGYTVVDEKINLGAPNFAAVAADMKDRGVDLVVDAIDNNSKISVCTAMGGVGFRPTAVLMQSQSWSDRVGDLYARAPNCRNAMYAIANTRNYEDTRYPAVAAFRTAMNRYQPDRAGQLDIWTEEGYASAQWLTDAMASCGAALTRSCVEAYLNSGKDYDGHGLLTPRSFTRRTSPPETQRNCMNVVRWQDSARGGQGGWVTQIADMNTNCFDVRQLSILAG